jgi:putative ABC transport system permease protein
MRFAIGELALVWRLFRSDLAHNRKRILLTVMAIAWGTLSIVLLLSFGEGMKRSFAVGSRGMGEGIAVVWPGATTKAYAGLPSGRNIQFKDEDLVLLRQRVPEIAALSGEYARYGTQVSRGEKSVNVRVRGVEPEFGPMRNLIPEAGGRFINDRDILEKRRVAVLGPELADDLFGRRDVVGETVEINRSTFLVVGVTQEKIQMGMYGGPDSNQATIPLTTFKAQNTDAQLSNIVYKPVTPALGDRAQDELFRILGGKYRFDPEDRRALGVWDTRENQRLTDNIAFGIQIFLGIIGALTLFVGGMGIANIMYAVVKERTREIGVKMALGAKMRQVMAPFVMEALLMTVIGGVLGTLVSLGLIGVIAVLPLEGEAFKFLGRPTFSPAIAAATALVLGAIGTFAGYFPARRAAAVHPAVSLRYE